MKIKNFVLNTGANEYEIDIEIGNINWENDSIGWYEYGSAKEFDYQESHVGEFEIEEVIINGTKVIGLTFDMFHDLLVNNKELVKKIEETAKEEAESDKVERLLAARED